MSDDVDNRLGKAAFKLDLTKQDLARHAIRALVEAVEKADYKIVWPPDVRFAAPVTSEKESVREIVVEVAREEFGLLAAEKPPRYRVNKKSG